MQARQHLDAEYDAAGTATATSAVHRSERNDVRCAICRDRATRLQWTPPAGHAPCVALPEKCINLIAARCRDGWRGQGGRERRFSAENDQAILAASRIRVHARGGACVL